MAADMEERDTSDKLDLSERDLDELVLGPPSKSLRIITQLQLDYNNITHLPENFVSVLPQLEFFSANGNNLSLLPQKFGSLTALREVHLCENRLTELPNSMQYLVNLRILRLTGNNLTCLPDDFGEMEALTELGVEENELTKFPPTFALLTHLRILEASHNKISILPKYFGNLHSLTHLDLCSNQLEEIPESFGELPNLVCVDLSQNKLKTLPSTCSAINSLKKFFAGQNVIDRFPEWLGHLPELTTLCLKENMLTGVCLPPDFGKACKKLQHLNLCGNHLTELPDTFGELESLRFCHFGSMLDELERKNWINGNWLRELPASFPQLKALTVLRLDENQVQFVPEDFGKLCNLEVLNMGQNLLYDLPESFGDLKKLRVCLLSRNNIQLLPSSFGSLSALEELRVDNNQLAELPESFKELTQLKVLDLFHNHLHELPTCLPYLTQLQFLDLNQNPIKLPKKQIPYISKSNEYTPRDPKYKGTWRGRLRDKMDEFVDIADKAIRGDGGDEEDDEVNEDADELYGSEDAPYNFGALQRAAQRSLWSQSTWRSHSGPEVRPLFVRDVNAVVPKPVAEREDSSSCAGSEDAASHSHLSATSEEAWNNSISSSSSVRSHPLSSATSPRSQQEEESWDCPPIEEKWGSPAAGGDMGACQAGLAQTFEENWDEELTDPCGFNPHSFYVPPRNGFSYNPKLKGFFFLPSDLHAEPTPRLKIQTVRETQPELLVPEENQFSDAEES